MEADRKRIGRPRKAPTPGSRVSLGLKVTPDIKHRLDQAAQTNGRTQSQEAEHRLQQTFEREDLLSHVLELSYGSRLAGITILVAETMWRAGSGSVVHSALEGGETNDLRERMQDWPSDPAAFDQAIQGVFSVLKWARPADSAVEVSDMSVATKRSVEQLLHDVRHAPSILGSDDRLQHVRRLLGPIAERETPAEERRGARLQSAGRRKRAEEQSS